MAEAHDPAGCPHLGLVHDPRTRFSFASSGHRCHAKSRPATVNLARQASLCLSAGYPECELYRAARSRTQPAPVGLNPAPVTFDPAPAPVDVPGTRLRVDDGNRPARRGRRRVRLTRVVVVVLALAAVLTAALLVGGRLWSGGRAGDSMSAAGLTVGSPRASASAPAETPAIAASAPIAMVTTAPIDSTAPTESSAPTDSLAPTLTPTPPAEPTPTATRRPTRRIHVVAPGETLVEIAARYGVTVKAIQKANRIADPAVIHVGQRLVIPAAP